MHLLVCALELFFAPASDFCNGVGDILATMHQPGVVAVYVTDVRSQLALGPACEMIFHLALSKTTLLRCRSASV